MRQPTAVDHQTRTSAAFVASLLAERQSTLPHKVNLACSNPRKYFDLAEMAELVRSFQVNGACPPTVVRLYEDGVVVLIVSERRYIAAMIANGQDYEIPSR